ncbi:MAG: hypothetical protein WCI04_00040 [archaeon]
MTDAEYEKKYSKLTEKQKLSVQSLIRLGDMPKLALATTLLNKDDDSENSDTWNLYKYAKGSTIDGGKKADSVEYNFRLLDNETLNDEYYVEKLPDGKKRVHFKATYWILDREGKNTWNTDAFVGYEDLDNVDNIDEIKKLISEQVLETVLYHNAIGHKTKMSDIDIISKHEHNDFIEEAEEEEREKKERRRRGNDDDNDEYRTGGAIGEREYIVVIRNKKTGEEQEFEVFAESKAEAKDFALGMSDYSQNASVVSVEKYAKGSTIKGGWCYSIGGL